MIKAMPEKVVLKKVKNDSYNNMIYMTNSSYSYKIVDVFKNDMGLKKDDLVVVDETKLIKTIIDNEEYYFCFIDDVYACIM